MIKNEDIKYFIALISIILILIFLINVVNNTFLKNVFIILMEILFALEILFTFDLFLHKKQKYRQYYTLPIACIALIIPLISYIIFFSNSDIINSIIILIVIILLIIMIVFGINFLIMIIRKTNYDPSEMTRSSIKKIEEAMSKQEFKSLPKKERQKYILELKEKVLQEQNDEEQNNKK